MMMMMMMSDARRAKLEDLVARLVGPAGPELTCEECFDHLDEYVELELAGSPADEKIPGMRAHLQGCPACDEDHESLRAFVAEQRNAGD
jgi:hypothetical protein